VSTQTTHNLSRKHKETVLRVASNVKADELNSPSPTSSTDAIEITNEPSVIIEKDENMEGDLDAALIATTSTPTETEEPSLESSGDPKLDRLIAKRIIASPPISSTTCLFCPHSSSSPVESTAHMRASHSFIIPEEEYLVDLEGLLRRLGEEVGTWNVCVCCGKGYGGNINLDTEGVSVEELKKKASKGVEAVRKHMKDKVTFTIFIISVPELMLVENGYSHTVN
jgi:pre-60S factor REI1